MEGNKHEVASDTASAKHSGGPCVACGLQPGWQYVNDQGPVNGLDYVAQVEASADEIRQEAARDAPAFTEKSMT